MAAAAASLNDVFCSIAETEGGGLRLAPIESMGLPHRLPNPSTAINESRTSTPSRTLDSLCDSARTIDGIWADDVEPGDRLVVQTENSTYLLTALPNRLFRVSGGWFAAEGLDDLEVRIIGCTWGGRAILTRLVAAPGMCIEFDNTVQTTSVRDVRLFRSEPTDVCH